MTPEEFDDIVAAYALDAVESDDATRVEIYIAEWPEAMAEVERLRTAAVWYGATDALAPPPRLRASILGHARAARAARPANPPVVSGAEVTHIEACDYLRDALGTVPRDQLDRTTQNGLTIRELIAHLAGMESQVADSVGNPRFAAIEEIDNDERTCALLDATRDWTFEEIVAEWETATTTTREVANERDTLRWFHNQTPTVIVETFRAFETWIHAGDIDVTMGRDRRALSDIAFGQMAVLSAQLIPRCLDLCGTAQPGRTARLVLTGPGAGEFVVPLAPGGDTSAPPSVTLEAPVMEWCMRIGNRIEPDGFPMTVTGDADLARDIVEAANSLAML
jgi:uncharacterized protein (TIGR03083 family)